MNLGELSQLRSLTPSFAAWLLARYPERLVSSDKDMLTNGVAAASLQSLPTCGRPAKPRKDPRSQERVSVEPPTKIYTDYPECIACQEFITSDQYTFVDSPEEADFLFVVKNIRNFLQIDQLVCQFPYEGGFLQKVRPILSMSLSDFILVISLQDLLPLTVREYAYTTKAPYWWLPCFDLSTEFHFFSSMYRLRFERGLCNDWIIKPATGTRAIGHKIIISNTEPSNSVFKPQGIVELNLCELAAAAPMLEEEASEFGVRYSAVRRDTVAQLLVHKPLLVRGVKFDLRVFAFMKSFEPFIGKNILDVSHCCSFL